MARTMNISRPSPTYGNGKTGGVSGLLPFILTPRKRRGGTEEDEVLTSMWRSVALVKESMTMSRTSGSGRWVG